jgi:hypothetical protein
LSREKMHCSNHKRTIALVTHGQLLPTTLLAAPATSSTVPVQPAAGRTSSIRVPAALPAAVCSPAGTSATPCSTRPAPTLPYRIPAILLRAPTKLPSQRPSATSDPTTTPSVNFPSPTPRCRSQAGRHRTASAVECTDSKDTQFVPILVFFYPSFRPCNAECISDASSLAYTSPIRSFEAPFNGSECVERFQHGSKANRGH